MDHTEAINHQAVERYLLGQMPETEIDEFEKHFFECGVCAEGVESGMVFQENVRAVSPSLSQPAPVARRNSFPNRLAQWWARPSFAIPAFAAVLLAVAVGYQTGFEIPALRKQIAQAHAPQSLLAFALRSGTRGEATQENRITVPAATQSVLINVDLTDTSLTSYRCDLSAGSGPALFSIASPAPPPDSPLNLLIPVAGLQPGTYTLRVSGVRGSVTGSEIARYTFVLQLQ